MYTGLAQDWEKSFNKLLGLEKLRSWDGVGDKMYCAGMNGVGKLITPCRRLFLVYVGQCCRMKKSFVLCCISAGSTVDSK